MSVQQSATGAHRAAAFLLSMQKEQAAEILRHVDQKVLVEIVEAMGSLDTAVSSPDSVRELYLQLAEYVDLPDGVRAQDEIELRRLLEETFDEAEAQRVLARMNDRQLQERPFRAIEFEPPGNISNALAEESDAVIAAVLAHLTPGLSAQVLAGFPEGRALDIVRRMATLIPPSFHTLVSIAEELADRLDVIRDGPVARSRTARLQSIAEVLNFSEPGIEKSVLEGLNEEDSEMATEIRDFMFQWDDLASIDSRAMQKILASIDTKTLSLSLKGSSPEVSENILANLSSRVRDMVEEERELLGALPLSEIESGREEILKSVRALIESGEFRPARAGEDLVE